MQFQPKSKELLGSVRLTMDAALLAELEAMPLYGDATRSSSREQYCPEAGAYPAHFLAVAVYRPLELVPGTPCLVRTVRRSQRGSYLYKIVVIPHADKLQEGEWAEVDPEHFWQEAYWKHLPVVEQEVEV